MKDHIRKTIEDASVSLPRLEGRGVLVPGGVILTAAHCVSFETDGGMVLGDYHIEEVLTNKGLIKASVIAVEPVLDIAVLGQPDNQALAREADKFDDFCENTTHVPISLELMHPGSSRSLWVYGKESKWIELSGEVFGDPETEPPMIWVNWADHSLQPGDSGSPIVNEDGELISVFSNGDNTGHQPIVNLALPAWVLNKIRRHQLGEN